MRWHIPDIGAGYGGRFGGAMVWGLRAPDNMDVSPGSVSKYQQHFLQPLMMYLSDGNAAVRQAAAYGKLH